LKIVAFFKISIVFSLIFLFLGLSGLLRFFISDHYRLQIYRTKLQSILCRWGLRVLSVEVKAIGSCPPADEARLMVGNHMSYLDVLILCSLYSSSYVTSQEIRETFFLGMLCDWAGCLFVERRNRSNLSREVLDITEALKAGQKVTIFPEATSTNGEEVLRFRAPLYQSAMDANLSVQAFCLNYLKINGVPFHKGNRDFVCWYGDMSFLPHLWALCLCRSIEVSVEFFEPLTAADYSEPKALAQVTQYLVATKFIPVATI